MLRCPSAFPTTAAATPAILATLFTSASVNSTPFHIHPRHFILLVLFHLLILFPAVRPLRSAPDKTFPICCLCFPQANLVTQIYIILDFSNFHDREITELYFIYLLVFLGDINIVHSLTSLLKIISCDLTSECGGCRW